MVVATVLCRTRLAASFEIVAAEQLTGSLQRRTSHTGYHIVVSPSGSLGIMASGIERIKRFALHLSHYMRHIIVSPIGNGSTQVGYLQRRKVNLTLTDRNTDNRQSVP